MKYLVPLLIALFSLIAGADELRTENTLLRPFRRGDFRSLVTVFFDHPEPTVSSSADSQWLEFMRYLADSGAPVDSHPNPLAIPFSNYAIVRNEPNELIGFVQVYDAQALSLFEQAKIQGVDLTGSENWHSLGYSMRRDLYEEDQLMPEVLKRITDHGFKNLGTQCFYVNISPEHLFSENALKKTGFHAIGQVQGPHPHYWGDHCESILSVS